MLGFLKRPKEDAAEQIAALYRRLARDPDPAAMRKAMSALYKAGRHAECLLMVEAYEEAFPPHSFVARTKEMLARRNAFSFRALAEALHLQARRHAERREDDLTVGQTASFIG